MTMNTTKRWFVYAVLLAVTLFLVWKSPESDYAEPTVVQAVNNSNRSVKPNLMAIPKHNIDLSEANPRAEIQPETLVNLFETNTKKPIQVQPKTEVKPKPVYKPTAPPLPFKYIGKLVDNDETKVFLLEGQALHIVRQGDKLGNSYQLKAVEQQQLTWVYLPMNVTQKMSIGRIP